MRWQLIICVLSVLVTMWGSSAMAEEATLLTPGTIEIGFTMANKMAHYKVDLTGQTKVLTVFATSIGDGDPDILAGFTNPVTESNAQFVGLNKDADSITLSHDMYKDKTTLYISILGFTSSTEFSVVASFESVITLENGVPLSGDVPKEGTDYFTFLAPSIDHDVTFSIVSTTGSAVLMVSAEDGIDHHDISTYDYITSVGQASDSIAAHKSDKDKYPPTGKFYLAIYGDSDATYTITASTSSKSVRLRAGVPHVDHVEEKKYEYFTIKISNPGCDLKVDVTPLSGDPDVFMSATNEKPTREQHDKQSIRYGVDSVEYKNASPADYHIGVYAMANTTFSITASVQCGPDRARSIRLVNGLPQSGSLTGDQSQQEYKFHVTEFMDHLTVSVARTFGDPDIYIRNDGETAGVGHYMWSSVNTGEDIVVISKANDGAKWCLDCDYSIVVVSSSPSTSYSITASTSSSSPDSKTSTMLQMGVSKMDNVAENRFKFYSFQLDHADTQGEITITVTPFGRGDPDLYVSTSNEFPNTTATATWEGRRMEADSVTIPSTDKKFCTAPCTYYIGVKGSSDCTYSVLVTYDTPTRLVKGVSQRGAVAQGAFRYYDFQVSHAEDLDLTLTTLSGQSTILVSTKQYPELESTSFEWYSADFLGSVKNIKIAATDPKACRDDTCRYYVAVYGYTNSSYSLVMGGSSSSTVLQNGVPMTGSVAIKGWTYYNYKVDIEHHDLTISVTPITGDADVYVSTTNQRPNMTNFDERSIRFGQDSIDLKDVKTGMYYIGVNAIMSNATYTITCLLTNKDQNDGGNVYKLVDGMPQHSTVDEGQYQYYQIDLSSLSKAAQKKSVTFSLTREYGNPDLYITTALPLPSTTHFEEISMTDDYDVININGPKPTVYYLAVYGRTDASFTVTASTADVITTLQDGRPVRGFLEAGGINHYHYTLGEDYGKKDITINLTPFSGDPDLYITTSEFGSLPNKTNYQWNAVSYRDDSITISHADENACKTVGCTYFVGVSSYTPSSFTVTAVLQDVVMLEDGVPQTGSVEKHAFRYYRLEGSQKNTNHKDITFTVTPMSGNPNIYIGKGDGSYPTLTSYSAHTSSFWNGASLTLKAGDEGYCSDGTDDCAYIIGVYGSSASSFSISVTTSSQSRTLLNGVPVQEDVGADGWEYFTFDVDQQGMNVVFSLTPITGDPDLFVSDKFTHPNDTNANAKSQAAGADAVTITHSKKKRYYVGVHAWSNTTFTLTAYMMSPNSTDSEHAVMLVSGVPQHTILAQDMDQYYHFFIDEGTAKAAKAVTVALTRKVGDPDFYVGKGFKPSADKYDYKSEAFGSDIITIGDLKAGDYFVKVHAASTCDFTLMYSNDVGTTTLQDGVAQTAVLEASAYQYFSFNLEHIDDDTYFTVIVTSFHGDPDLYISSKYQRPNVTHHDYAARAYLADSITIPHKLLKLTTYYIGVSAFTPCTFTVIASTRRQLQLQDGVPQTGDVKHEESKLYKLTSATDKEAKTLTFTVTPFSGSAYMYISTSEHGTPVVTDSTSYVWASNEYMTSQTIVIQKNDENACRKAGCEYIALVYGRSPSNYTIVASSSHSTTRLQDGIAQRAMVAEGTYEYFIFELTNPKAELSFTTTPITGDPDLFVSATVTHPTREEATWRGMSFGGDAVHIDYTDKDYIVGTYYVSVFAWANTTFTIMASVADLSNADDSNSDDIVPYDHPLINGVPQTGILQDKTSKAYYAITVPASTDVESLTLTISASVGDPDVFVTIDGSLPSRTNNQYKSDNWGRDTLVVPMLECKGEICLPTAVRISVEGDQHTLYTISATTSKGATTLIAGGQPIMVTLTENESRYFKMYVDAKAPGLTITATALSGDCDMFVSMENQYPTRLDSDWSSMKAGSDTVFIANPKAGTYFIGLDAFSASSFTLSATIGATKLSSGIPQHGEMNGFNDLREYSFTLYDENKVRLAEKIQDVVITVTPVGNGDVDMFVSNGTTPTRHDYMWSTIDGGSNDQGDDTFSVRRNEITLRRHEHDVYDKDVVAHPPCFSGCTYYVVLSAYTHVQYTITVTTNDVSKLLEAGKPTSNFVSAGEYTYYRAIIDNDDNDINIVSTNFVGEIDLYVTVCADDNNDGCITKPTTDQHTWFSGEEDTVEGDHIGISHELDTNYRKGMYFIGVYGVSDSHFSITLSTSNTMIQDGIPTVAHTSSVEGEGVFFFYDYDVPDDFISDIEFHLSSIGRDDGPNDDGGHARRRLADGYQYEYDLYVSTKSNSTKPSKDDYEFHQRVKAGEALIIPQTFTIKCRSCVYFLGVYGVPNQMFRLRVTNDDSVLTLIDKQSTQGNVEFNRFNYYEMYVPDASEFSVKLETCKGNADLYIAQDTYKPSLTQYGWKSANKLDIDETDIKDPSISQSSFYIGVYGHEDSDYHLTAITKKSSDPSPETQLQIFHPSGGPPTEAQVRAYQTGDHDESMPTASQYKRGDGIVLVFPLAWDAGSAADRDTSLRYTVYYAEMRENLVLYTACGLQRAVAVEALTFTNGDIRDGKLGAFVHDRNGARELMVEIPNLASGEWYKFNVMVESASDSSASRTGDQYLIYKDAYNVQVAQPDSSDYPGGEDGGSGISFTTVMTVAIPMLVVVSVIIAVLVYRNKMLTQELQIEMHDLPKQAMRKATRGMGGASGQRGGRNNYNHLLDMDSGMDSLGDYMAPGV